MERMEEETLVDSLLIEEPDDLTCTLFDQPEEDSLFSLLNLEEKRAGEIETLKFLAKQGEETAIYGLGVAYMEGKGIEQDFAEASYWFEKSKDASSKMYLAYIHEQEGNAALAMEYNLQGAEAKEDVYNVRGMCYYSMTVEMLKSDIEKAELYFRNMLECQNSEALQEEIPSIAYMLGLKYLIIKNYEKAVTWSRFSLRYDSNNQDARDVLKEALAALSVNQMEREVKTEMKTGTENTADIERKEEKSQRKGGFFSSLFGKKKS